MGGLFGGKKPSEPKAPPAAPKLSDTQMKAKDSALDTRRRRGIEDQVLSMGSQTSGGTSLLGKVGG